MHMIWATEDFTIDGRPYPGFPIVLHDSLESAVEANQFLRHYLTRGKIGSEQSWPSTGRALYDYFGFLEAHGLHWSDVDRGEEKSLVAAYRDYCLKDVKLARNTVRQRIHYICAFYDYALREGWVDRLPYGLGGVKRDFPLPTASRAMMVATTVSRRGSLHEHYNHRRGFGEERVFGVCGGWRRTRAAAAGSRA